MKHKQTRETHRLHIPNRRDLRDIAVAASAVVAAGVFTVAAGDRILADEGTVSTAAPAPTADECGRLWDRVPVSGQPDATVDAAAAEVGLVTRGSWISFDGVTWEHVDGRIVTVAHPRSAAPGCDSGPSDESSRP